MDPPYGGTDKYSKRLALASKTFVNTLDARSEWRGPRPAFAGSCVAMGRIIPEVVGARFVFLTLHFLFAVTYYFERYEGIQRGLPPQTPLETEGQLKHKYRRGMRRVDAVLFAS